MSCGLEGNGPGRFRPIDNCLLAKQAQGLGAFVVLAPEHIHELRPRTLAVSANHSGRLDQSSAASTSRFQACQFLDISRSTLGRYERVGAINPGRQMNDRAGASVFRRADIERLVSALQHKTAK